MIENVPFCGEFIGEEHQLFARVYFADTDFSGVVYHARYLEFLERGRSEFLRLSGINHRELANGVDSERLSWAVHKMNIDYHKSAHIDDILDIRTKVKKISGARITMGQVIFRNDFLLVTADVEVALVNSKGRPKRIPDQFIGWLSEIGSRK